MRCVTVRKFSSESGYTEAAIRAKIQDGTWLKGDVWPKAADGRVLIDVEGYESWVGAGKQSKTHRGGRFRPGNSPEPIMSIRADLGSPKPLILYRLSE